MLNYGTFGLILLINVQSNCRIFMTLNLQSTLLVHSFYPLGDVIQHRQVHPEEAVEGVVQV